MGLPFLLYDIPTLWSNFSPPNSEIIVGVP